jgi:parvulin-like peptidyl-prolyl isomerase
MGIAALCSSGWADEPSTAAPQVRPLVIAAKVNGVPIYAAEVADELDAALKGRKLDDDQRPRVEAEMLRQLVDRRLVLAYLRSRSQAADKAAVDEQIALISAELKKHGTTLPAYLAARGISEEALRQQIAFRLSWKSYVERHVNDTVLERFFNSHRRDYDGTQVLARQILLAHPKDPDTAAVDKLKQQAAQLRQQIEDGKLKFEDAAAQHSSAPSKAGGGDLGWIPRHGSLPETLAAAAFALDAGQVSQPVVTRFGVHLVQVTDVKPGTKTWRDVAGELQSSVVRRGFAKIATAQNGKVPVEFTGAVPFIDAKNGRLVEKK